MLNHASNEMRYRLTHSPNNTFVFYLDYNEHKQEQNQTLQVFQCTMWTNVVHVVMQTSVSCYHHSVLILVISENATTPVDICN